MTARPSQTAARRRRARLTIAFLALAAAALGALGAWPRRAGPRALSYTALLTAVRRGEVEAITIHPGTLVEGRLRAGGAAPREVTVALPTSAEELVRRAEEAGVEISFAPAEERGTYSEAVGLALILAIIAGLGYVAFLQLRHQSGAVDVAGRADAPPTTFAHVAGQSGAVAELREIVEFLKSPQRFRAVGARTPKGALLVGPPGTGKTLLARAVAGEAGVPFFAVSGSQITGFIVGLGAHRIRTLFREARRRGGVIFIDEIDALGAKRGRVQGHGEDDRTLNQLLVEMDGFSPAAGVVVIAATNRPEELDPALRRPGRFDRTIVVPLPGADEREEILRLHVSERRVPLAGDVDLRRLARLMPRASGADLANLVNEAAIAAVRTGAECVGWTHVEAARDRLLLGKERAGVRASPEEWRTVAVHEAGHALVGVVCCPQDGLHKVTIQPRGEALGVAHFAPDDDRHLHSRRYLEAVILKTLGGRAAEAVVFGDDAITSGARSDLEHATRVAKSMVYQLGMGEATGLLVYDGQPGSISPEAHAAMDRDVIALLDRLYGQARHVVSHHRAALDALADALLERETLEGAEAVAILEANGVGKRSPRAA